MARPPSRGRQIVDPTRALEKFSTRQSSFSKQKETLFEATIRFCLRYGEDIAVVVFSESGRAFGLGYPSIDAVLRRAPGGQGDAAPLPLLDDRARREEERVACRALDDARARVAAEKSRMKYIAEKVQNAMGEKRSWWQADVEKLGKDELQEFIGALTRLRNHIRRLAEEATSASPPPPPDNVRHLAEEATSVSPPPPPDNVRRLAEEATSASPPLPPAPPSRRSGLCLASARGGPGVVLASLVRNQLLLNFLSLPGSHSIYASFSNENFH